MVSLIRFKVVKIIGFPSIVPLFFWHDTINIGHYQFDMIIVTN